MAAPIPPSNLSYFQLFDKARLGELTPEEEEIYKQKK